MNYLCILKTIKRFRKEYRFRCSEDDVRQEICLTLLEAGEDPFNFKYKKSLFAAANNAVARLEYKFRESELPDYLYPEFEEDETIEEKDKKQEMLEFLLYLYRDNTVKEICEKFNVEFSNRIAKLFCKLEKKRQH